MASRDQVRLEVEHLQAFQRLWKDCPRGEPRRGIGPDFLFDDPPRILGIEHTQFIIPPRKGVRPRQIVESFQERLAHRVTELLSERALRGVHVNLSLFENRTVRERGLEPTAHVVADAVAVAVGDSRDVNFTLTSREVASLGGTVVRVVAVLRQSS